MSMLGGDDFDILLADLAIESANVPNDLSQAELFRLHEECRAKKEALHPNTKRISIDLGAVREGWPDVINSGDLFTQAAGPLSGGPSMRRRSSRLARQRQTRRRRSMSPRRKRTAAGFANVEEVFGRRVHRSAYNDPAPHRACHPSRRAAAICSAIASPGISVCGAKPRAAAA